MTLHRVISLEICEMVLNSQILLGMTPNINEKSAKLSKSPIVKKILPVSKKKSQDKHKTHL